MQKQRRIRKHWITDDTWQLVKPVARMRDVHHACRMTVGKCRLRIAFEAIRHDGVDRHDSYPYCILAATSMTAFKNEATALRVLEKQQKLVREAIKGDRTH